VTVVTDGDIQWTEQESNPRETEDGSPHDSHHSSERAIESHYTINDGHLCGFVQQF